MKKPEKNKDSSDKAQKKNSTGRSQYPVPFEEIEDAEKYFFRSEDEKEYVRITSRNPFGNFDREKFLNARIERVPDSAVRLIIEKIESGEDLSNYEDYMDVVSDEISKAIDRLISLSEIPDSLQDKLRSVIDILTEDAKSGRTDRIDALLEETSLNASPEMPLIAPALWKTDKQHGDTPPDFIKRHYSPWLRNDATGLGRADLKRLDPSLYTALANWLRKPEHTLPEDCPLPTVQEKNDAQIASLEAGTLVFGDSVKDYSRLMQAKYRRER
jgi:hypothetical protein